jgi:hypothetical protein
VPVKQNKLVLSEWFDVNVTPSHEGVYLVRFKFHDGGYRHYLCKWVDDYWHWGSKRFNDAVTLKSSRIHCTDLKSAVNEWCGLDLASRYHCLHDDGSIDRINKLIEELDG